MQALFAPKKNCLSIGVRVGFATRIFLFARIAADAD